MALKRWADAKPVEMAPGVVRRTLNYGERTLLSEVTMEPGSVVPWHSHPHEQIGYLVSGRLLMEVGEDKMELGPGDTWLIPGDIPHQATAIERCLIIDVFSPVREEYIER